MPTPGGDPQFNLTEREDSQLAALDLLARIGYKILTREEALALRGAPAHQRDHPPGEDPRLQPAEYPARDSGSGRCPPRARTSARERAGL
jgi:hypothetical protein